MKTTSSFAASSRRTGCGEWYPWTTSSSEGVWRAWPGPGVVSGASPGCDEASHLSCHRMPQLLPDSLTTWEIHAVSLSKTTGGVAVLGLRPPSPTPLRPAPFLSLHGRGVQTWGTLLCPQQGWQAREQARGGAPPPLVSCTLWP